MQEKEEARGKGKPNWLVFRKKSSRNPDGVRGRLEEVGAPGCGILWKVSSDDVIS